MGSVISLTDTKIQELMAGWAGVALSQEQINALVSQLMTNQQTYSAVLENFKEVLVPQLRADLSANDIKVAELNDTTLPNLEVSLENLNDVILPDLLGRFPIVADDLAADSVTANKILAHTITALQIAANTITANEILADTITANEIAANAITANELSTSAITTEHLVAGTVLAESIGTIGLTADWIRAGTLNADRLSVGSAPISVLPNSNMEDPGFTNGAVDWNKFAGWREGLNPISGSPFVPIVPALTPISGSRAMRLVLPSSVAAQRIFCRSVIPVAPGQIWSVSAKFRTDKTVNKADSSSTPGLGDTLLGLMFHTSETGLDPESPDSSTETTPGNVQWQVVESIDSASANQVITLSGTVTVPPSHRHMRISMFAGPSTLTDGTGYAVTIDEVMVAQADLGITIVSANGSSYGINETGDATFRDLVLSGNFDLVSSLHTIDGVLISDRLASISTEARVESRGLLKKGFRDMAGASVAATVDQHILSVDLSLTEARALDFKYWLQVDSTTPNNRMNIAVRYTYSQNGTPSEPTETSPNVQSTFGAHSTGAQASEDSTFTGFMSNTNMPAGNYKFALYIYAYDGSFTVRSAMQALHIYDVGQPVTVNSAYFSGTAAEPPPVVVNLTPFTLEATHSKWWTGGNTFMGSGDSQYFGNTSANAQGRRKSASWFDKTTMINRLNGKPPAKLEAYLYIFDGGQSNTVAFGKHDDITPSSNTYPPSGANRQMDTVSNWDEGSGKWVTLNNAMRLAGWEVSGGAAGLIIGPESSDADSYSAGYRGATASSALRPKLRFTPAP